MCNGFAWHGEAVCGQGKGITSGLAGRNERTVNVLVRVMPLQRHCVVTVINASRMLIMRWTD